MNNYYHAIGTGMLKCKPFLCDLQKPTDLTLNSPASEWMQNYSVSEPLKVSDQLSYDHVKEILCDTHSDYLLVQDHARKIIGFIPVEDIVGLRSMERAHAYQQHLSELSARELMESVNDLPAISMSDVVRSTIGDIVHTFKRSGAKCLLVTNSIGDTILGLFSARAISRALEIKLDSSFHDKSNVEIAQAVTGHFTNI